MKNFFWIGLFMFFGGISCQSEADKLAEEKEEFDAFLFRFNADSIYQVEHVRFPFESVLHGFNEPVPVPKISRDRWQYIQLLADSCAQDSLVVYEHKITPNKDTVFVREKSDDDGVLVEYSFAKEHSDWVLVRRDDFSY